MPTRFTPRHPTMSYLGTQRFSWTICTYLRRRYFIDSDVVSSALVHLSDTSTIYDVGVLAYCFMPDHVHLLIEGTGPASDSEAFVAAAKQRAGFWFRKTTGNRLWQKSSWDRALRDDEDTWTVMRYILANPVRAGIVSQPIDYPYSGSLVYTREQIHSAFDLNPAG